MYSAAELATLDVSLITPQAIEQVWLQLNRQASASARMGGWTSHKNVLAACEEAARTHGITDVKPLSSTQPVLSQSSRRPTFRTPITDEFVGKVRTLLPPQPWKPGIHRKISAELGCETSAYFAAVERLIEDGVFLRQRDGVLYDSEGNVVAFDAERVDPDTLELLATKA
jgi:hypothetical protein